MSELRPEKYSPVLGAEAKIELVHWYGRPAIRKSRVPKSYRLEELDRILRSRRTKQEVEILYASKMVGVDCPRVFFADPVSCEIVMEYVQGVLLKDLQGEERGVFERVGQYAGILHSAGIIHGDLTTKNVIISGERIALIDFGLAFFSDRIEDRAEDLHLLKQALKSTNSLMAAASKFGSAISGYEGAVGKTGAGAVKKQIAKIELRGRYAQVD